LIILKENTSYSVNLLRILVKFMTKNGIDLLNTLEEANIDPLILKDSEARISTHQFNLIWKKALHTKNLPNMGLDFGREIANAYFKGNILFGMMANAPTVGKALEIFCRYHILSEDAILPKVKIKDDLAFLSWQTASHHFHITRQVSEALLCALSQILKSIADNNLKLLEVRFQHGSPIDIQRYEDIFQAPLRFNQQKNEIVIRKSALNLSVFLSDPTLFQTLEQLAQKLLGQLYDPNKWTNSVLGLIGSKTTRGEKTSIDMIASNLAVSPRKLQSRLKKENTTFQKILDQARKEIASTYLRQKKIPICDIALLLGFSEQSAFNHAFRRWTGLTPGQYRKTFIFGQNSK